nr:AraC family transcriptional regulator [uncultured Porphyromonas sp.]
MTQPTIQRYPFNSPSSLGLEVKPLTFLSEKAEKASAIHRADFYLLLWVEEGRLSLSLDFEDVCIRDEEALLISPGQVVRFYLDSLPKGFAVLFVPEFVGEATSDIRLLHQLLGASLRGYKVSSLHGLPIPGLMHQLMRELTAQESVYQLIIARSCLRILLAEVARRLPREAEGGGELAGRFFAAVEEHHHHLHNIQDYQRLLGVMEKQLAGAVRQAVGMTPKAYLDQRRLLEAKRLLSFSDLSIKEVAYGLGFDEPTNFNKFFRKHAGLSPGDFRLAQGEH